MVTKEYDRKVFVEDSFSVLIRDFTDGDKKYLESLGEISYISKLQLRNRCTLIYLKINSWGNVQKLSKFPRLIELDRERYGKLI